MTKYICPNNTVDQCLISSLTVKQRKWMKNIIDIEHHMSIYVPLTQISENFMQKILSSRGQEVPIVNNRKCIFTQCVSEEPCMMYDVYTGDIFS